MSWFRDDLLPVDLGGPLLDVGAADGHLDRHLVATECRRIVAVELDAALVARHRDHPDGPAVPYVRADGAHLPIRDASVPGVLLLEVLEHVDDPTALLREAARVLAPGGILCVGVPTAYTEVVYGALHPRYRSNAGHVRTYRLPRLLGQIEGAGLAVVAVEPRHLESAVAWLVHSVLRTDADGAGRVRSHHGVEPAVERVSRAWAGRPHLGRAHRWLTGHVGKSWHVYARREEAP